MNNFTTHLFNPIKNLLDSFFRNTLLKYRNNQYIKIPKYSLSSKHLLNARILASREKLLELLPKDAVCAEIGVDEGSFSEKILDLCQPQKLHLVDFWGSKRYNQDKRRLVEKKFADKIADKEIEINLGLSIEVASQFPDNYFDWIYIDTDHSYATTLAELNVYKSKMKPGGIIAGHDFMPGNWADNVRYGVIEAVHEFCVKNDWQILYITAENPFPPSFAITNKK